MLETTIEENTLIYVKIGFTSKTQLRWNTLTAVGHWESSSKLPQICETEIALEGKTWEKNYM